MADLQSTLLNLEGKSYKAYRGLNSVYPVANLQLYFDSIQGDPFASPSQCRVVLAQSAAGFPPHLYDNRVREIALRDYLTRRCAHLAQRASRPAGSGKSGQFFVSQPSQVILDRSALLINTHQVELRLRVGLPAYGRRIAGSAAAELLCHRLPDWIHQALTYADLDGPAIADHLACAEDAEALRSQLAAQNLVAFVADGAILPRESGVSDRPLQGQSIPFRAPPQFRTTLHCPHRGSVTGMAIPAGVTLIVGGGYHGKSTLLQAIQAGVYNHILGDGREYVVSCPSAIKIRAEEGRSVQGVDLSPFINDLPLGQSTTAFCTENASGSTSQAANIIEAVEAGAQVLLLDEDTSATNFMIRDRRMQALITKDKEPITPFIDQVRRLYEQSQISTVLVMGGSGDYFDVADHVIAMDQFQPRDCTQAARRIAAQYPTDRTQEATSTMSDVSQRVVAPQPWFRGQGDRPPKVKVQGLSQLQIGDQTLDVSAQEHLVETGQLRTIAQSLLILDLHHQERSGTFLMVLQALKDTLNAENWDALTHIPSGELAAVRPLDVALVLNRLRSLRVQSERNLG
ncbi:ABC-ATPase domain-containing protein [Lyngbya confervoides]|uniref:ABC-ATPase domain-containing protein n=1 Tax=Lyngbya confervoides BDU141951 TaxID=1574623 RepID=A0ABD4T254_9CYAN|nr:ABC-ATPase domain-containing protein [Lyngbya confervoides]MCM1982583.1 ABC-ATPase domain-containing protein [Lyngbya confervoides BDU141951]